MAVGSDQGAVFGEDVTATEAPAVGQRGLRWRSSSQSSVWNGRWNHTVCDVTVEQICLKIGHALSVREIL